MGEEERKWKGEGEGGGKGSVGDIPSWSAIVIIRPRSIRLCLDLVVDGIDQESHELLGVLLTARRELIIEGKKKWS